MISLLLLFAFGVTIDQVTKFLAVTHLSRDISVLPVLNFALAWNKGISWGMLNFDNPTGRAIVTALIIFVTGMFLFYTLLEYKRSRPVCAEVFVLAGAISNIIDRFVYGAVVDFIGLHLGSWYWPTFNVADVFIVMGIIGIFFKHCRGESNVCQN